MIITLYNALLIISVSFILKTKSITLQKEMDDWILRFTNLKPKFYKNLGSSFKEVLGITDVQSYLPIMSLFFHIHNTRNSHKCITFDNRYIIKQLKEEVKKEDDEDYKITSNGLYKATVWDKRDNKNLNMEVFCKICPILDSVSYMQGNYNIRQHRNHLLPSNYNHNTFNKINCLDNSAYIDAFFCYIGSFLREKHHLACFPLFYGTFNGIANEFFYDISEEYYSLKNEDWFEENLGHLFSLDVGVSDKSDSEEEELDEPDEKPVEKPTIEELPDSDEENKDSDTKEKEDKEEDKDDDKSSETDSDSSSQYSESNDYIAVFEDYPVQTIFMEKCDKTLGEVLEGDYTDKEIKSILFQTIFGLAFLQKHFNFTHNDLHINNIMVTKTDKKFLVYRANKICYRVPTCGYIAKIIDFGRAIYTFRDRVYFNDVFSRYGEAEGQYSYPKATVPYYKSPFVEKDEKGEPIKEEIIKPNPNFDVTRLATTVMDDLVKTNRRKQREEEAAKKSEEVKVEEVEAEKSEEAEKTAGVDESESESESDSDSESSSDSETIEKYYPDTELFNFLKECVTDDEGVNLHLEDESFDLYKRIAKHAKSATPKDLLKHKIFGSYKVQRKTLKNVRIYSL